MVSVLQWPEANKVGEVLHFVRAHARPAHYHPEVELNIVTQGCATYRVGAEVFDVVAGNYGVDGSRRGAIVGFRSMLEHELLRASWNYQMWVVYLPQFTPNSLKCNTSIMAQSSYWEGVRVIEQAEILQLEAACEAAYRLGNAKAHEELHKQIAGVSFAANRRVSQRVHPAALRAVRYLEEDVTLSRRVLAGRVGLSEGELSRLFCRSFGVPLVTHRNRLRIGRLLQGFVGERSLLDAAYAAGFGSSASLHRVFLQEVRYAPAAFLHGGAQLLAQQTKALVSCGLSEVLGSVSCYCCSGVGDKIGYSNRTIPQ